MWFVIGCVIGELAGRWFVHVVYIGIIAALLIGKQFCS